MVPNYNNFRKVIKRWIDWYITL